MCVHAALQALLSLQELEQWRRPLPAHAPRAQLVVVSMLPLLAWDWQWQGLWSVVSHASQCTSGKAGCGEHGALMLASGWAQ